MATFQYIYKGTMRVHVKGVRGFIEPKAVIEVSEKINNPLFEPMFNEPVEKSEEEVENKKRKIKHE